MRPRIGLEGEYTFVVGQEHVIDFAEGGMPAVLSTPRLIGLIERTAREALRPLLDEAERTVGVEVDIRHLAPTPPGMEVTCRVKVVQVDLPFVTFQFEARDKFEPIARGLHRRAVIQVGAFAKRVGRKSDELRRIPEAVTAVGRSKSDGPPPLSQRGECGPASP